MIAAFCGLLLLGQLSAFAGTQDFILRNNTGAEIYHVYVSRHSTNHWEEDVLGRSTLADGESTRIHFSPRERASIWDLRIEDRKGNYLEWYNLDLNNIEQITLYFNYDTGRGTADLIRI